ncbi:MAG: hypothetical protein D6806_12675, partial [Deltaproteobacteria bacterium]
HFWFEVGQPNTIVSISLKNNTPFSPVDLCYDLFKQGQSARLGGQCDDDGMDGVTDLSGSYYLEQAGIYFIEVHDQNDDEEDPRALNNYLLSINLVEDPDPYEPNNSAAEAKEIGSQAGYISFMADEDWFKIQVQSPNQMLVLDLQAQDRSTVDLRYEVLMPDGTTPVNSGQVEDGRREVAQLHDVLALDSPGWYYIKITDAYDDDTDTSVGYTLTASLQQNPDVRDRGPTNDTWQDATPLTSGQPVTDGYLATRADEDWYVIDSPGVTDSNPALLEVELEFPSSSPVIPSVDLIVPDPNTPCNPGDACDYLVWECGGCNNNAQCQDAQCPSHSCDRAMGKCVAANECFDGGTYRGCGIRSLIMQGPSFGVGGDSRHLKTVAPMYGPRYYFRVADYGARHLDPDNSYRFTVTVHPEPDTHESPPNGLYLPYITKDQEQETRDWNKRLATPVTCSDNGTEIVCGPITGYISFRGDQDWYVLTLPGQDYTIPKETEADPSTAGCYVDFNLLWDWSFSGSGMSLGYVVVRGGDEMGPELGSGSGTWGNGGENECSYVCGEYQAPTKLYLWVFSPGFEKYDFNNPYNITIRAVRGVCPQNCSYCRADTCDFHCPNPVNAVGCGSNSCQ